MKKFNFTKWKKLKNNECTLHNGDCLEYLKAIQDETIDLIVTDPPYGIGIADWDKEFNVEKSTAEWKRILKPDGQILCFAGWSTVIETITELNRHFTLNDWIVWDRIKGRGAKKRLVSTREDLLWYVNSKSWVFNKELAYSTIKKKTGGLGLKNGKDCRALSNVWTDISPIVPWSKERVKHPTQKPLQIMERILTVFSAEGQTILDPFMGSGTTGVACKKMNRKFIGIEIDKAYFEIAQNRISNTISD